MTIVLAVALAAGGAASADGGISSGLGAAQLRASRPSLNTWLERTTTAWRRAARRTNAVRLGTYAPPSPEQGMEAAEELERRLGTRVGIISWYQHWDGWGPEFNPEWVDNVVRSGRVPLVTWEPWSPGSTEQPAFALARIAGGSYDGYVRSWAKAIREYGKVVYLRPMHEMNGNWYPWGGTVNGNSPREYVAAWRRIWGIFEDAGTTNVRWVWSPNAEDVPASRANAFERYYPGDRYVDVLALDGYNWGAEFPQHGGWRSFEEIFASPYRRIAALGRQPIWIAETASAPEGGDKAAWVRRMFAAVKKYPRLAAIVWFHADKERDWRATSPPGVEAAFAQR
jgi:hypothetical protein